MSKIKLLVPLFLVLTLTQCGATDSVNQQRELWEDTQIDGIVTDDGKLTRLRKVVDNEAGVVCYNFWDSNGIYCLPISETKIDD